MHAATTTSVFPDPSIATTPDSDTVQMHRSRLRRPELAQTEAMDKPLPPLPNAAAVRGSDAGLSSVPDLAQRSQRPLIQIADADYECARCRFTHSLCVPLTALRSRLRCPRCLESNAFGLQLLISGTRILQKTARLVQVPVDPIHRPRVTWECCNCSKVHVSTLRPPKPKARGCYRILFTSLKTSPTSTHSVLMEIITGICYDCGHTGCSECDHFMCRNMALEDREVKVYLACVSERGTTQSRLSHQNLKLQQRREACFTEVSLQRPHPTHVSGIYRFLQTTR